MAPGRPLRLPVHRVCAALERGAHAYNYWADKGLLFRPNHREGITEQQAVEWAILQALRERRDLTPSAVRNVWPGLRQHLATTLAQGIVKVWIGSSPKRAVLSLGATGVNDFAAQGGGVMLIDASSNVQIVRNLFRSGRERAQQRRTRRESREAL
jgi:hypothetical protein